MGIINIFMQRKGWPYDYTLWTWETPEPPGVRAWVIWGLGILFLLWVIWHVVWGFRARKNENGEA